MVIPDDWKEVRLGEIAEFTNGKPNEQNVVANGRYLLVTLDSINIRGELKTGHKQTNLFDDSLRAGDIVTVLSDIAHGNLLGLCGVIPLDDKYVLNQRMGRIRLQSGYDPGFIRLKVNRDQNHFKKRGQGTSQRHIYRRDFDCLKITLPNSVSEQKAIADALSDVDALIDSLDALIAKKRDVKQATMQQLLTGRIHMPGFTVDWKKTELRSVLKFQVGFPFSSQSFAPNGIGIRLIRNADLKSASSAVSIVGAYPEEFAVQSGDLLIGMDGDFAPIIWKGGFALLNQRVGRVICGPEMNKGYARYELARHLKEIEIRTGATTVKHLSHNDVASIVLKLPPLKEQEAIAEALTVIDDELEALTEQVSKLRMVKEGMMQDLLTGKVRLV